MRWSSDFSLTSTLYQPTTTMDSDDTKNDSGHNLMHQTNDKIRIGENAKVTQHDPEFENADESGDEEHIESPHFLILAVNVV